MKKVKDVDEYIETAPLAVRRKLREIRKAIKATAPDAVERISYGMPYYSYKGRLAYFAYAKEHIGFYAMPSNMKEHLPELKKYSTATATIRFPLDEKLPIALIKRMVKFQVKLNDLKQRAK